VRAVRCDDYVQEMPIAAFFDTDTPLPDLHAVALEACRGHVLDAGAGAGRHSLALQSLGYRVTAMDISARAVQVMRRRGVADARAGDIRRVQADAYDTILMLMNGIGIVGTLAGLRRFLREFGRRIRPGGQIIIDSWDFRQNSEKIHRDYYCVSTDNRAYAGETFFHIHYDLLVSTRFCWLFVAPAKLIELAAGAGLHCEILAQQAEGSYLARLVRRRDRDIATNAAHGR
jgi:SAM-dependent methyltransferase